MPEEYVELACGVYDKEKIVDFAKGELFGRAKFAEHCKCCTPCREAHIDAKMEFVVQSDPILLYDKTLKIEREQSSEFLHKFTKVFKPARNLESEKDFELEL